MKSAVKLWSEFYCVKTPEFKKKKKTQQDK